MGEDYSAVILSPGQLRRECSLGRKYYGLNDKLKSRTTQPDQATDDSIMHRYA